uniref:Uncharacterized protein n=1 Tax=Corvus moneduloides TaxID=1196302 RepID=A0A8U7NWG3_CORMO
MPQSSLGAVALGTFVVALLLRWLWDALVAVTRFRATCRQLNKFPIPPWRNWLLGHTGMPSWLPRTNFSTASSSPGWVSGGGLGWGHHPWVPPEWRCHRGQHP